MPISSNETGLRAGICTSTTRPSSPYKGQMVYETDTSLLRIWDGSAWAGVNTDNLTLSGSKQNILDITTSDYRVAKLTSSGPEVNVQLNTTSTNGRNYSIVSGGSGGALDGGRFGIYDNNANAIRFSINANGAVSTPSQPFAMLRGAGGNWFQGTNSVLAYAVPSGFQWGVVYNIGGHFNTTTGLFIAPVTGVYLCSFQTYQNNYGGNGYMHWLWYVGGTYSWAGGNTPYNIFGYDKTAYADGAGTTLMVYLTAGNGVGIAGHMGGDERFYSDYTYLSFRLLG